MQVDAFSAAVIVCISPTASDRVVQGGGLPPPPPVPVTVMPETPVFPSLAAVIVADPAATAVTRPVELTVAFVPSEVVQVTVRPVSVAPLASRVVAVSCCVAPTASDAEDGVTTTLATGLGMTVREADPETVPTVAMISVVPAANPVTVPVVSTEARVDVAAAQVTLGSGNEPLSWSKPAALAAVC